MPETTNERPRYKTQSIDDVPLVTFNFRHYTRNGLKSLGIVNEPVPLDPFDLLDPEKLSEEEALQLFEVAQAALKSARKRIKQEHERSNSFSSSNKRARIEYDPDELEEIPAPTARSTPQDGGSVD